jgi:hypothetical protein
LMALRIISMFKRHELLLLLRYLGIGVSYVTPSETVARGFS